MTPQVFRYVGLSEFVKHPMDFVTIERVLYPNSGMMSFTPSTFISKSDSLASHSGPEMTKIHRFSSESRKGTEEAR